jgi:hypothetical protein
MTISVGDLVSFEPWDCEGIEMPYGFKEHLNLWDPEKKKIREDLRKKEKITPGATGLVTEAITVSLSNDTEKPMFWCIVEGKRLLVHNIFVNKVQ